jgi:hypothetical protein
LLQTDDPDDYGYPHTLLWFFCSDAPAIVDLPTFIAVAAEATV